MRVPYSTCMLVRTSYCRTFLSLLLHGAERICHLAESPQSLDAVTHRNQTALSNKSPHGSSSTRSASRCRPRHLRSTQLRAARLRAARLRAARLRAARLRAARLRAARLRAARLRRPQQCRTVMSGLRCLWRRSKARSPDSCPSPKCTAVNNNRPYCALGVKTAASLLLHGLLLWTCLRRSRILASG